MANTHHYELIGDSHLRGLGRGEDGVPAPIVIGKSEQMLELLDLSANLGSLAVGDIVEQIPLGVSIRARIVQIIAQSIIDATIVVEPVAGDAATNFWPTLPTEDPGYAWDTYSLMNINGSSVTAIITRVTSRSGLESLNSPTLERVTAQTTFYDPQAKPAQYVDVTGYTNASGNIVLPGDQISCAPSGATFIVCGLEVTSGTTARFYICRVSGTPAASDTLTNDQVNRALSGTTISAVGAATSAGQWVQFSATPSLARSLADSASPNYVETNTWEVPPRGDRMNDLRAGAGPIAKLLENIERHHQRVDDPGDSGHRLLAFSSNDAGQGFVAGVTFQRIDVTSQAGTWATGDTVTSSGTWSATVVATDGAGIVYVHSTNGETLANAETLTTSSGGTATATGPALGWAPGSRYWNDWVAYRATARAAPGATEGGAAIVSAGLFLMIWEGEIAPYASIGNVPGLGLLTWTLANAVTMRKQWVDFIAAARVALGVDVPVTLWLHAQGSQPSVLTGAGILPGIVNLGVRNFLKSLPAYVDGLTVVDSEERGHKMAVAQDGSDSTLWIRPLDYVDVGQLMWSAFYEPTLAAPPGNFEVLPVVIGAASQSQLVGFNQADSWASADGDPDLWPMNDFPGLAGTIDTRDPNLLVWNHAVEELQVGDVSTNFNTFWTEESTSSTSGSLVPVMQRMKQRYGQNGGSGKVALFKAAVGGSCYSQNVVQASGCWSPSLSVRPTITQSVTVTHVTVGATQYARFTAAAGTFASLQNGHSITIAGGAGVQGAGGNNTPTYGFNTVNMNQSDGSFFDIEDSAGTLFADGTETLEVAIGPPPLWPELVRQWNLFVRKAAEAGYIVRPVAIITEQGESDLSNVSEYPAALDEVWTGLVDLLALRADKNDQDIAKCLVQMSANSPFSTTEEPINTLRGYQATKAGSLTNCVLVDPSSLPFESSEFGVSISSPPFPRQYRLENAIHFSGLGMLTKGYLIDQALATLTALIPAHPKGELQLFAAVNNGANLEIGQSQSGDSGSEEDGPSEVSSSEDGAAEASLLSSLSSSQIDDMMVAVQAAWSNGVDVFSYSVNGTTVTRNTPQQMIELHRYLRSLKQETAGIRRTRAVFNG